MSTWQAIGVVALALLAIIAELALALAIERIRRGRKPWTGNEWNRELHHERRKRLRAEDRARRLAERGNGKSLN